MNTPLSKDNGLLLQQTTNRGREILYGAIAFLLPFSVLLVNIAIILLVLILVIDLLGKNLTLKYEKEVFYLPAIFFVYALSLLYSQDVSAGLSKLETKLSLVLLPMVIGIYNISEKGGQRIRGAFILSCLTASLICILNAFYVGYTRTGGLSVFDNQYFYDRNFFVSAIGFHPPYFGMYLATALLFLLKFITKIRSFTQNLLLFAIAAVLLVTLLLIHARMAQISLLLLLTIWMIYILIRKKKLVILFAGMVCLAGISILAFQHPFFNKRIMEVVNTPFREPAPDEDNSVSLRYGQLYCSAYILQQHPVLGVGVGDTQQELNKCYTARNYHPIFTTNNLNTHNQYFDIGLSAGAIGLLLLLTSIISLILSFYRKGDITAVLFILLIAMAALTESIFNTFKGVVFFSFLCSVFLATHNKREKIGIRG